MSISYPHRMKLARLLPAILLVATVLPAQLPKPAQHVVGFMTDFDVKDDAIGICKAVMVGIDPEVRIIDISHQVTPYDITEGARFLAGSAPYFPADAVFVIVVDPTVGSTRKAIIARSMRGQYFVLPDNGLLTLMPSDGPGQIVEAREITNPAWMIGARLSSHLPRPRHLLSRRSAPRPRRQLDPGRPQTRRHQTRPPRHPQPHPRRLRPASRGPRPRRPLRQRHPQRPIRNLRQARLPPQRPRPRYHRRTPLHRPLRQDL